MQKTYTHEHPILGALTGRLLTQSIVSPTAQIVHFRSIPFATIPSRFKLAKLLTSVPQTYDERSHRDFTEYGHACPGRDQDSLSYGGPLPEDGNRTYDEFTCLNLTISVPKTALESSAKAKLPVMVYVHGGAMTEGAGHIAPSHDTTRMVALSVEEDMPVIIVSIHYRLSWFGFLTCQDLLDEAAADGRGVSLNPGLWDQKLAFRWVHKFIGGFSGDASDVTAFGESGGSISLSHHLCADEPLFKRAILQSGVAGFVAESFEEHDAKYQRLLKYLGINEETREGRLQALREVPGGRLVEATAALDVSPYFPYLDVEDPFWPRGTPTYDHVNKLISEGAWCDEIILGDTSFEGFMLTPIMNRANQKSFAQTFRDVLQPEDAQKILAYYGISTNIDHNLFVTQASTLVGDLCFSEPIDRFVRAMAQTGSKKKVYRYHFSPSNPFPGSQYSYVTGHHFLDILYVFLTLLERYPTHRDGFYAKIAKDMASKWLNFANGRAPWTACSTESGHAIAVCDDLRGWEARTKDQDIEVSRTDPWGARRYEGWQLLSDGMANAAEMGQDGDRRAQDVRTKLLDIKKYIQM